MAKRIVEITLAKCHKTKKLFGIRNEKMSDGKWHQTWAFPIDPDKAKREGFDKKKISGQFVAEDEYKCPHCGTRAWSQCGKCGKIYCDDTKIGEVSTCPWCGNSGKLSQWENFDLDSGSF